MDNRINYYKIAAKGVAKMMDMEKYLGSETALEKKLVELVKIRVSQINGCAYCINMHTQEARKLEETEQRIYLLNAWEETDLYSAKEKMALEFAETLTLIADTKISDELYQQTRVFFDEKEYADLIFLINQVNSWNRLSIAMGNKI